MLFIECAFCQKTVFVNHIEFHMAEHIGINGTIELFKTERKEEEELALREMEKGVLDLKNNERTT